MDHGLNQTKMTKKNIFTLTFIAAVTIASLSAKAQKAERPPEHLAIKSASWDIINDLSYKMDKSGDFAPVFSDRLKDANGKLMELKGYIVPFKMGAKHKNFAISVLPISQCYFCGTGNIPPMVEVIMKDALPYTDKIITVKGKIKLNADDSTHMEIILEQAEQVD
ncbi:hypothetical protein Solca_2559 [Solitalea canadensis DSM 3403]|uniref:DUF3299 domain-containing protein n=2 Tax=Solitalea canadensis TaxID=995 RepID=H8KRL2_SOLCM|nr:hypothetical protein Solca_2559 [Solitalea canadensis DSM 3403]